MGLITTTEVIEETRHLFVEETGTGDPDFVSDDEILLWFDQGAEQQHDIVLWNGERTGRLREHDHAYLRHYLAWQAGTTARGVLDYALPSDYYRRISLHVGPESPPYEATYRPPDQDRLIREYGEGFGPANNGALWTLMPTGPGAVSLRIYGDGVGGFPVEGLVYWLTYYRTVRTPSNVTPGTFDTDVHRLFARGPKMFAVGKMVSKGRREGAAEFYQEAIEEAQRVMPPPPKPAAGGGA